MDLINSISFFIGDTITSLLLGLIVIGIVVFVLRLIFGDKL